MITQETEFKTRIYEIIDLLREQFPEASCTLNFNTPFELLIATILSSQCTDERVNKITPALFAKYQTPQDFINADKEALEKDIYSTGFYKNKARNIQSLCRELINNFNGQVPKTMEELILLPGVARKTANVVLGNAFGISSGIVVDTHVQRVVNRLGLSNKHLPEKIEFDLMKLFHHEDWISFGHLIILHGRLTCKAKKPLCDQCCLNHICPRLGV